MKYACCKSPTGGVANTITCTKCKLNYHIQCLQASGIKKDGKLETRKQWLCPECTITGPRRGNGDNTPVRAVCNLSRSDEDNCVDNDNVTLRRGGSSYTNMTLNSTCGTEHGESSLIELIRSAVSSEISILKDDFKKSMIPLQEELKSIREEFLSMKECFEFINSSFDNFNKRVESCEKDVQKLNKQFSELGEIRSSIATLKEENDIREQFARMNNLEISGIPITSGENLYTILHTISSKVGIQIDDRDVDAIRRVRRFEVGDSSASNTPTKNSRPSAIVVKFTRRMCKDKLLAAVRARRGLTTVDVGISGPANNIYVSDHLTPQNKLLLKRARQMKSDLQYSYLWIRDCKILMRKNDHSKVIAISKQSDLSKLK